MDARISIQTRDGIIVRTRNQNVLLEEFKDGYSIHSDTGTAIDFKADDCISVEHTDIKDEFKLNNGNIYTIEWL